jgi:pimeloyl-ACP methyl ester carboxylesterase
LRSKIPKQRMFDARDLRAIAQLAGQATHEVTNIVQGVHSAIGQDPFGITRFVYNQVRGVNRFVGKSLETVLLQLEKLVSPAEDSPERLAVLAALNGVMGDRLFSSNNHLAIKMQLIGNSVPNVTMPTAAVDKPTKLLIFVHGLCMNDLQWVSVKEETQFSYGHTLQHALDYTPIHVRYNTGRGVVDNGQELAAQLEALVLNWPTPIDSINIVGYSMGGLVSRAARSFAILNNLRWAIFLQKVIFIGTPHSGAPLEQMGHWIDQLLKRSTYTAPFVALTQLRSQGINDLRSGLSNDLITEQQPKTMFYSIAGCTSTQENVNTLVNATLGDGLVPVASALNNDLIAEHQQRTIYKTNHLQLLHSKEVSNQLVTWLK